MGSTSTNPFPSSTPQASLLCLLQFASPALPVGAYSYSEGLETLVTQGVIVNVDQLQTWISQELTYGTIKIEVAVMVRVYRALNSSPPDLAQLSRWNTWLSALRETTELRQQSWQMGRALLRLLQDLDRVSPEISACFREHPCNFAVSFALAAAHGHIDLEVAVLGYLQSWSTNLINAGIKLIPLGQTAGQRLMLNLHPILIETTAIALALKEEQLQSCSWGLSLASMQHETQYSRLFRS